MGEWTSLGCHARDEEHATSVTCMCNHFSWYRYAVVDPSTVTCANITFAPTFGKHTDLSIKYLSLDGPGLQRIYQAGGAATTCEATSGYVNASGTLSATATVSLVQASTNDVRTIVTPVSIDLSGSAARSQPGRAGRKARSAPTSARSSRPFRSRSTTRCSRRPSRPRRTKRRCRRRRRRRLRRVARRGDRRPVRTLRIKTHRRNARRRPLRAHRSAAGGRAHPKSRPACSSPTGTTTAYRPRSTGRRSRHRVQTAIHTTRRSAAWRTRSRATGSTTTATGRWELDGPMSVGSEHALPKATRLPRPRDDAARGLHADGLERRQEVRRNDAGRSRRRRLRRRRRSERPEGRRLRRHDPTRNLARRKSPATSSTKIMTGECSTPTATARTPCSMPAGTPISQLDCDDNDLDGEAGFEYGVASVRGWAVRSTTPPASATTRTGAPSTWP